MLLDSKKYIIQHQSSILSPFIVYITTAIRLMLGVVIKSKRLMKKVTTQNRLG